MQASLESPSANTALMTIKAVGVIAKNKTSTCYIKLHRKSKKARGNSKAKCRLWERIWLASSITTIEANLTRGKLLSKLKIAIDIAD